jgi:F-type H+-transporting ATPase subunit b
MEGGNPLLEVQAGTIIWTLVTFVVLLVLLRLVAWKPVLGLLDEREKAIKSSIEDAEKAREEAEKHLAEGREALKSARQEMSAIIEKGQREAERLRQEMLAKAQQDVEETRRQGLEEIDREKRGALAEIRTAAVDLAVAAAGRIVASSMDEKSQRKIASDFLTKIDDVSRPS